MADEADLAQAQMERELAAILARRLPDGPQPTGACLWCAEPLPAGRRWCDAACHDAWQAANPSFPRKRESSQD